MITLWDASAPKTSTFTTTAKYAHRIEYIGLFVNISAVSGTTPTLVVKIQESADGTNFADVTSFTTTSLNATGTTRIAVPTVAMKCAGWVQAVCTIGGTTPSFTFTAQLAEVPTNRAS